MLLHIWELRGRNIMPAYLVITLSLISSGLVLIGVFRKSKHQQAWLIFSGLTILITSMSISFLFTPQNRFLGYLVGILDIVTVSSLLFFWRDDLFHRNKHK